MNKLISILVGLLFSTMAMADGVESLKAFFHNTNAMRADFNQVVKDHKGEKVQEVGGSMKLKRPNKFRWDYNQPYEQQIVSDGKEVFLYDTDLEQVTVRELSKTLGSSPAAMLAGGDDVEKSFTLKNAMRKDAESNMEWVLAVPKDKDSGFDRILLAFEGDKLRHLEMYDSFNHITYITFDNVERNPSMEDSTFLFTTPEGADVVGE